MPHDLQEKPTHTTVSSFHNYLSKVWTTTHAQWSDTDSYIDRTFALWSSGSTRPSYHPATPTSIIDGAADTQLAFNPIIHRPIIGKSKKARERADRIEPAIQAMMTEAALRETLLTWKQLGRHLLSYGYGVVEGPIANYQERPDKPRRERGDTEEDTKRKQAIYEWEKRTWFPARIRAPHPARVLMDPELKQPDIAIVAESKYAIDLYRLTTNKKRTRRDAEIFEMGDDPYAVVNTISFWTKYWHAVAVDGGSSLGTQRDSLLYVEKNTWGYLPYSHAFAGFGMERTASTDRNPASLSRGILDSVKESIKIQAQEASARHNAVIEAGFNKRGTRQDAGEMGNQLATSDLIEGEPGDLWWLELPDLPQYMFQEGQLVDRDIESGTYSRALSGIREPGVSTVGQQAILSTAANRKFAAPNEQMNHMATVVASNLLRLIDVLGEKVTVRGFEISPDDIQHDYSIWVQFQIVDPVLSLQQRELGMREVASRLKSRETYWSADAKLEDASGEAKRILQDEAEQIPEVRLKLMAAVLKEFGIIDELLSGAPGGEQPGAEPSVLGPDGNPLASMMGMGDMNGTTAGNQLRQALTPDTPKPGRLSMPGSL